MYCPNCGKKIQKNSKFCPYCGHKINSNNLQNKGNLNFQKRTFSNKSSANNFIKRCFIKTSQFSNNRFNFRRILTIALAILGIANLLEPSFWILHNVGNVGNVKISIYTIFGIIIFFVAVILLVRSLFHINWKFSYPSYNTFKENHARHNGYTIIEWIIISVILIIALLVAIDS